MAVDRTRHTVWLINQRGEPYTAVIGGRPKKRPSQKTDVTYVAIQGASANDFHIVDLVQALNELEYESYSVADVLVRVGQSPLLQADLKRPNVVTLHVGALAQHEIHAQVIQSTQTKLDRESIAQVGAVASDTAARVTESVASAAVALDKALATAEAKGITSAGSGAGKRGARKEALGQPTAAPAVTPTLDTAVAPIVDSGASSASTEASAPGPLAAALEDGTAVELQPTDVPVNNEMPDMSWSVTRMVQYAAEHGIDVSSARGRNGILSVIRLALKARA